MASEGVPLGPKRCRVRLSVGATPGDVLVQFLGEALVLCLAGGLAGVLASLAGAWGLGHFLGWELGLAQEGVRGAALDEEVGHVGARDGRGHWHQLGGAGVGPLRLAVGQPRRPGDDELEAALARQPLLHVVIEEGQLEQAADDEGAQEPVRRGDALAGA